MLARFVGSAFGCFVVMVVTAIVFVGTAILAGVWAGIVIGEAQRMLGWF